MAAKRILVIEDEQIVARDLQNLLRRLGHVAIGTAANGEDAVRIAAETLPDLILMDVQLDGMMDGVQASFEITRRQPVPIVYITAFPGTFLCEPSKMVSPFLCVAKPFSAATVQAAIDSALGSITRPN